MRLHPPALLSRNLAGKAKLRVSGLSRDLTGQARLRVSGLSRDLAYAPAHAASVPPAAAADGWSGPMQTAAATAFASIDYSPRFPSRFSRSCCCFRSEPDAVCVCVFVCVCVCVSVCVCELCSLLPFARSSV